MIGVLWVDPQGAAWEQIDSLAIGCLSHLLGACGSAAMREQAVRRADALEEQLGGPAPESELIGRSEAALRSWRS
ncbi:MAG: hypothetical protein IPQ07_44890 [Myxococcales bacterium]|nr:hypothetical protein [Myxococcales bacterium]